MEEGRERKAGLGASVGGSQETRTGVGNLRQVSKGAEEAGLCWRPRDGQSARVCGRVQVLQGGPMRVLARVRVQMGKDRGQGSECKK